MDKQIWIDHLSSWKQFLTERIRLSEDDGEKIKCERQIRTIERVRCGAVLNPALVSEFISSSDDKKVEAACDEFYFELNGSQKQAVRYALGDAELALIQGPPGTGKTQVIAEVCLQLLKRDPGIRILVCSETHVAVNNLLSRIKDYSKSMRIVRIRDKENDDQLDAYSPEKIIESYLNWAADSVQNKDALNIIEEELNDSVCSEPRKRNQIEKALALSANIVGMTCNRAAAYDFRDKTEMFDVAIIDEVCKATLPEILSPMIITKKAILLGDPKQLPPVFCTEEQDVIKSIKNCNLNRFMYIDALFADNKRVSVLDTQYRMSNQIGNMISELFYNGAIKNGRNEDIEDSLIWITYQPTKKWPLQVAEEADRPRIYNEDECKIIVALLEQLVKKNNADRDIAVIAPYRAQVSLLRQRCSNHTNIKIDTVDGFQGKESDIVIFSLTRTVGTYRFISDDRRLNVALSRAKDKIYIIGDKRYVERSPNKSPILKDLISRCKVEMFNIQK